MKNTLVEYGEREVQILKRIEAEKLAPSKTRRPGDVGINAFEILQDTNEYPLIGLLRLGGRLLLDVRGIIHFAPMYQFND